MTVRITSTQLKRIIAEETRRLAREAYPDDEYGGEEFDWDVLLDAVGDALEALPLDESSATSIGTLAAKLGDPAVAESAAARGIDVEDAYGDLVDALARLRAAADDASAALTGLQAVL